MTTNIIMYVSALKNADEIKIDDEFESLSFDEPIRVPIIDLIELTINKKAQGIDVTCSIQHSIHNHIQCPLSIIKNADTIISTVQKDSQQFTYKFENITQPSIIHHNSVAQLKFEATSCKQKITDNDLNTPVVNQIEIEMSSVDNSFSTLPSATIIHTNPIAMLGLTLTDSGFL